LFINAVISFLIVAFSVFVLVRQFNRFRKEAEAAPTVSPEPPKEQVLLAEIRDLLKAGR
jgi:large conductance mechanosensitive channel